MKWPLESSPPPWLFVLIVGVFLSAWSFDRGHQTACHDMRIALTVAKQTAAVHIMKESFCP